MEISSEYKSGTLNAEALRQQQAVRQTAAEKQGAQPEATPAEISGGDTNSLFTNLLKNYGLKPTADNRAYLELLLSKSLPLDKSTLTQLIRAVKLLDSAEKALFLLENEIPVTMENARLLNELAEGGKLADALAALSQSLEELPEDVKQNVMNILLSGGEAETTGGASITGNVPASGVSGVQDSTEEGAAAGTKAMPLAEEQQNGVATQAKTPQADASESAVPNVNRQNAVVINPETAEQIKAEITQLLSQETDAPDQSKLPEKIMDAVQKHAAANNDAPLTKDEIIKVITELFKDDDELSAKIFGALKDKREAKNEILDKLMDRFKLDPKKGLKPEDIEQKLNELRENLRSAGNELLRSVPSNEKLIKDMSDINKRLEFMNQMKDNLYIQIPVMINEKQTTAELYVFGGKKRTKNKTEAMSALVALDTAGMGRFEVFVEKNGRNIGCLFRLESDAVENTVRSGIARLDNLLSEFGYHLTKYTFIRQEEPFTLLDNVQYGDDASGHEERKIGVNYRV